MSRIIFFRLVVTALSVFFISCNSGQRSGESATDPAEEHYNPEKEGTVLEAISDLNTTAPFYIINVEAAEDELIASDKVRELRKTYEKANYLWIPDYASLSGKNLYSVFIGPFELYEEEEVMKELLSRKKTDKQAYALLVSHENKRVEMHDKYDFRVNGKKQKLIIAWADPVKAEEYYNAGGEDWGWYMNDVSEHFVTHYGDDVRMYNMPGWLTEKELRTLVRDAGGSPDVFGYVFVDGTKKSYVEHNPSFVVIAAATQFFGLK
jgi:hypothetical protein